MDRIDDLVERFKLGLLKNYKGGEADYTEKLRYAFNEAKTIGINQNIKFFMRRTINRMKKREADLNKQFNLFITGLDDITARNREYWKQRAAHYRYFHKDLK